MTGSGVDRSQEDSEGLVHSEENDNFANRKGVQLGGWKLGLQEESVYPLLSLRRHGPFEWQ